MELRRLLVIALLLTSLLQATKCCCSCPGPGVRPRKLLLWTTACSPFTQRDCCALCLLSCHVPCRVSCCVSCLAGKLFTF